MNKGMSFNWALYVMSAWPSVAFAYIDPASGGFLYQMAAPLVALLIAAWAFFMDQIRTLLSTLAAAVRRMLKGSDC